MHIQIFLLCLILGISSVLGACTLGHRIVGPREPIRIEMTLLLEHKYLWAGDKSGR